jgi:hypothetical protein
MRIKFLLLIFFLPLILFAQKKLGHAPFFKSFNANKLAHALTDGLDNDSLKIRSIYLWETRHIKYDVKSFQKGKPSYDKPRKILFHRKAVCLGYSILFDSLCHYMGISSEMVPGYAYQPWYEARDTFFLDDHAWNVALINGNWKLFDVTWASGHIKPRLQLIRRMLSVFGISYVQKYRFKRKRNDFYYETPPQVFIYNHLPSTPAWQLLPCSVPIDSFQLSPTAVMHFLNNPDKCADGNDSIPSIQFEPKCRHELIMGKQVLGSNKNNHQDISLGYWYYSGVIFVQAENKNEARVNRIVFYDSTANQLDSAFKYFKITAANAKMEQSFFLERNKRMKQQVLEENKPLMARQKLYINEIRKEGSFAKTQCRKLKIENRHLNHLARGFNRKRLHTHRPDNPKPGEVALTKELMNRMDSANASIKMISDSTRKYVFSNNEPAHYDSCLFLKRKILSTQLGAQHVTVLLRKRYFINSYDTVMINTKQIVFLSEQKVDSLDKVILHGKEWAVKKSNRNYAENIKEIDGLLESNVKICKQLAQMSETSFSEDSAMDAQKMIFQAWTDSVINENKKLISAYHNYAFQLHKLKHFHKYSLKKYHKEIAAEHFRFAATNAFFRRYYGGISDMMKHNGMTCNRMRLYCKARSNKLQKEEDNAEKKSETKSGTK